MRVRSVLGGCGASWQGVAAVGEPLLTGGVSGRGALSQTCPCARRPVASQGLGGARGGWARPSWPGDAVCSLRGQRPQRLPHRLGLRGQRRDLPCAGRRVVGLQPLVDVRAAVLPQRRDPTRALVCGGGAGLGGGRGARASVARPRPGHPPRQHCPPRALVGGGHRPRPRQECGPRGHRCLAVPIALRRSQAVWSAIPSMVVTSTPASRARGGRAAHRGALVLWCRRAGGGQGLPSALGGAGLPLGWERLIAQGPLLGRAGRQGDGLPSGTEGPWRALARAPSSGWPWGGRSVARGPGWRAPATLAWRRPLPGRP